MNYIRRYTTPCKELLVEGIDLSHADVYVTFEQGDLNVTFVNDRLTKEFDGQDTIITIEFSQKESAVFKEGEAKVQVNWIEDGKRNATEKATIKIKGNLLEEVIE